VQRATKPLSWIVKTSARRNGRYRESKEQLTKTPSLLYAVPDKSYRFLPDDFPAMTFLVAALRPTLRVILAPERFSAALRAAFRARSTVTVPRSGVSLISRVYVVIAARDSSVRTSAT
jgi:hypothetical protein